MTQSTPSGRLPATIGVDIGGTRYKICWLGAEGGPRDVISRPTGGHRQVGTVLAEIAEAIAETRAAAIHAGHDILAVGVGIPAVLDLQGGRIVLLPNFSGSWQNFRLAAALEALVRLPVHIINDARAYTLAESRLGAGRGVADLLAITLGTGVGGGLVLSGALRFGPNHMAGEFGHITYDPHGARCGCGARGCIEAYASGSAIAAAALRPLLQGRMPILRELIGNEPARLDADAVARAAAAGEPEAEEIYAQVAHVLGLGIAHVMKIADISCVVVGGGVAAAGEVLLSPLREAVRANSIVFGAFQPRIVRAEVEQAGAAGAALWAREETMKGSRA
ncbi:ROK family protein [Arsenicitalea aurantiaca]|uniref:ROK family protein n=1 Tax=Arsenicitalea aurantiaca TaxID=1783274 RepID=A0A433X858_9HYPH|nr:ROK family protein [Arsenicitalea aurantiaca]RUT30230.1 ROK family protein [Arsenicitalea aurantiaca]